VSTGHNISINNQAAGGNTVLSGGLGPTLLSRYQRDAITQPGVKYLMIFSGVNDIGSGSASTADALIKAYQQVIKDAKAAGMITIGGTIAPFQGNSYYSTVHEQARKKVNSWIVTGGGFDKAFDISAVLADGERLQKKFDSGDGLHPNVAGYQALADAFPLEIFAN
jgi:lysophospholipase L1-like esterase